MNVRNLLFVATILIQPVSALAQDAGTEPDAGQSDAGTMTEDNSATGQVYACTISCLQRVMSGDIRLDECVSTIPECAGLEEEAGAIRSGICQQARDLVGQCDPPAIEEPASGTAPAVETATEPRPRPRRRAPPRARRRRRGRPAPPPRRRAGSRASAPRPAASATRRAPAG